MGLVYRHAVSYDERTPLISSTFGLGTFFSKTSIYCKIKTIAFLFAFFVLYCLVYYTPGIILTMNKSFDYSTTTWAPWRFRTKTTPNKRPKLCMTNPLWGLQSSVPSPRDVSSLLPLTRSHSNAENVSMLCGWKCLKSGTYIKYHV